MTHRHTATEEPTANIAPASTTEIDYSTMTAMEIVQRATTIYQQAQDYLYRAQAQIMECLWEIKQHHCEGDLQQFQAFVAQHIDFVVPKQAVDMVITWEGARKNRDLRELAQDKPKEAMRMICALNEGGMLNVVEDDAEVARLLTMPQRKRSKAIRELMDIKAAIDQGHHPADKEVIKTLEAERDAALDELAKRDKITQLNETPRARFNQLIDALRKADTELAALNEQSDVVFEALNSSKKVFDDDLSDCQDVLLQTLDGLELISQAIGRRWGNKVTRLELDAV